MEDLKFASPEEALQHLANITGKKIKIASDEDHKYFDQDPGDQTSPQELEDALLDQINDTTKEAYKARKSGDIMKAQTLEAQVDEMMVEAKKMGITDKAEKIESEAQQEAM